MIAMATSVDYVEFVCEQIREFGGIRYRKMFGEYMVYLQDRPILLVCDNTVFVKELPELEILMEQAPRGYPYGGAKKHYILDIEAPDLLRQVIPILEKVIPHASIELFRDFQEFAEAEPERFIHYFVAAQTFAAHNAYFRARQHKTILLTAGQSHAGMHCIDVQTDEEEFVRALVQMQHSVRRPEHTLPAPPPTGQPLSDREAEVLALVARGLINKQIADRLGIGLTTVISHRRNIMEKLGIRSVAGLVVYALAAGYADPDGM